MINVVMNQLDKQLSFFEEHKDELLARYGDSFIVVSSDLRVDSFSSEYEAYCFGMRKYGLGNFLLKDCTSSGFTHVYIVPPTIELA